jgi:hypothetical protein
MLSHLAHFANRLWDRLASAASQLFRQVTQPVHSNILIGAIADLPSSRAQLLAENAFLRQQLAVLHRQTRTPRLS